MRFLRKMKSTKGESISETLVATLIAALSMLIFASMVIASKNIIKNSEDTMAHYYDVKSEMEIKGNVKTYTGGKIEMNKAPVYQDKLYDVTIYSNEENGSAEENGLTIYSY